MTSIVNDIFGTPTGDAALLLGDIEFGHMEVPDNFNFGGDQLMSVHQLVGGPRVINTLGRSDHDITWTGFFFGSTAYDRAQAVDFLRIEGSEIEFSFGNFLYTVVIKSFSATLERFYQIPYSITLTVIQNLTIPVPIAPPDGYNDAVNSDMAYINALLPLVGSAALGAAASALQSSISSAGNLANASQDQLNNILGNISNTSSINNSIIDSNGLS